METTSSNHIPFRNIASGTSSLAYVDKVIGFLEQSLPDFPNVKHLKKTDSENEMTEQLYRYLVRRARQENYPFEFQPEKPQKMSKGHDKRVDLAVSINTVDFDMEVVYCIEAKKLPTDRPGAAREKEYVLGQKGGIDRFKMGYHGKDNSGALLSRNGIIGYVTDHSFEYWQSQVNNWILAAAWPPDEILTVNFFSKIGKLTSRHTNNVGNQIELTHFWVSI